MAKAGPSRHVVDHGWFKYTIELTPGKIVEGQYVDVHAIIVPDSLVFNRRHPGYWVRLLTGSARAASTRLLSKHSQPD